jgi:hypothetical protein
MDVACGGLCGKKNGAGVHYTIKFVGICKSISKSLSNFTSQIFVLPIFKNICLVKKELTSLTVWQKSLAKLRSNIHHEP